MLSLFSQYRGLRKENYIILFGRIVTNMGSMVWPILTLILSRKMGYSATVTAGIMIAAGLLNVPAGLIGGKMADMMNRKHLIILFDLISVTLYLVCSFLPMNELTVVIMILAAMFQNMENPAYMALVADFSALHERERAYSLHYLGCNLGLAASPTIAGLLFENHLDLCFRISGLSILASTILIFFCLRDLTPTKIEEKAGGYQAARENVSLMVVLRESRVVVLYMLIFGFYSGAYRQFMYLMPIDLAARHGEYGAVIYGTLTSVACIAVVVMTPLVTQYMRGMAATWKLQVGLFTQLVAYVIFLRMLGNIPSYYILITIFTLGEVVSMISSGPYLSARVPASHRGRIDGMRGVFQHVFEAVCMLICGQIYDNVSRDAAWVFIIVFIVGGLALGLLLVWCDRRAYPEL